MIEDAVCMQFFNGFKIGREVVHVTYLQFADDTLFFCANCEMNLLN